MQLFSVDAMVFSKKNLDFFFDPEKVKNQASKVAHNQPRPFSPTVQPRHRYHRWENKCLVPRFHDMENHFWDVGCGLGWGKKGSRLIMSSFWGPVFHFFGVKKIKKNFWKHHSIRTEKLHWKKVKQNVFFWEEFFFQKNHFFMAKNATVST